MRDEINLSWLLADLEQSVARGKISMLQDVEPGGKTEVKYFGWKVWELGKNMELPLR